MTKDDKVLHAVAAYVRVSDTGAKEGDAARSHKDQADAIRAMVALRHPEAQVTVFEELDASGADDKRPTWNAMLRRAEAGEFDGIGVWRFNRATRRAAYLLDLIPRLERADIAFISVSENVDTTTPMGKFVAGIFGLVAELEWDNIRAGYISSRQSAITRGVWCSKVAPVGYARPIDSITGEAERKAAKQIDAMRTLVIDPVSAPAVRRAFEMRIEGAKWIDIARELGWRYSTCRTVVRNRVYLGEIHDKGMTPNVTAHPALVSRETWEAAQEAERGQPTPGVRSGRVQAVGIVRGLVRCAGCGWSMTVNGPYYHCHNALCTKRSAVKADVLDVYVETAYWLATKEDSELGRRLQERKAHGGVLAEARATLERVIAARAAFEEEAAADGMPYATLKRQLAIRDRAVTAARAELTHLLNQGADVLAPEGLDPEQRQQAERRATMARVLDTVTVGRGVKVGGKGSGNGWAPLDSDRVKIVWR